VLKAGIMGGAINAQHILSRSEGETGIPRNDQLWVTGRQRKGTEESGEEFRRQEFHPWNETLMSWIPGSLPAYAFLNVGICSSSMLIIADPLALSLVSDGLQHQ